MNAPKKKAATETIIAWKGFDKDLKCVYRGQFDESRQIGRAHV
mgnify:CR=1 FL=1